MAIIRTKDYRSDIVLTLHMTLGGETVNVPQHDFLLRFFTEHEARHYDCGRVKGEWLHCTPDESDTTLLTCYIKNHGLGCGMLQCLYIDLSPNDGMEDGVQRTFSVSGIDLELVDDASDDTQAVDGTVVVDINAVLTELTNIKVDMTEAIAAADAATTAANNAASAAASSAMSANTAAVRAETAANNANTAASDATSAASAANDAASSALQSQQKNIKSIVYIGAMGDGAANTVRITINDGTEVTGSVFNGHTGEKGEDGVSVVFGSLNNGIFYDRDGREAVRSADLLYVSISNGKMYRWGTNSYVYLGMTVDPQPTAGSSNLVSSGGVAAALSDATELVFGHLNNGIFYYLDGKEAPRSSEMLYVSISDNKLYRWGSRAYVEVSGSVLSATQYANDNAVQQTSLTSGGVISKMANGATTTYDLPAESGTLALASEVATKANADDVSAALEKKANLTSLYRFSGFSIIADGSPEDAATAFGPYVEVLSSKLDTYCPGWGDVADHRSILQLIRLNNAGSYNSEYLFTGAFGDGLRRAASEAHEMGFNSLVFPADLVVYEAGVDMLEERIDAVERDKADKSEVDNALSAYATGAEYDSASKRIYLTHGSDRLTGAYVDATAFIKDGMVDNVTINSGYLVITFNTDSGKEPISLAITDIFNASNYYTKAEIDNAGYLTQESDPTVPSHVKSITQANIASWSGKQDAIGDLADIRSGASKGATAYQKPSGGIPKSDLASAVQTSLGKADTALQSFTESDPTVPSWAKQSTKPTYNGGEVKYTGTTGNVVTNNTTLNVAIKAIDDAIGNVETLLANI